MNGIHDMGGMHGFGAVDPEDDEPFHEAWEKQFYAMSRVIGLHDLYTTDELRAIRERLHPADYLNAGYWEQRFISVEEKLTELGVLEPGEVDDRLAAGDAVETAEPDPGLADRAATVFASNSSFERESKPQRFEVGAVVVARNVHPEGHTRLPRYVRGSRGEVVGFHGTQMFPDAAATGDREVGEPLYSVRFASSELWGDSYGHPDSVVLQLFEPYLRAPSDDGD